MEGKQIIPISLHFFHSSSISPFSKSEKINNSMSIYTGLTTEIEINLDSNMS